MNLSDDRPLLKIVGRLAALGLLAALLTGTITDLSQRQHDVSLTMDRAKGH